MPLLTALAIVIGVMGGVVTWAVFGPLAAYTLSLWAIFVAWGAFYHTGGKAAALKANIPAHILGAVLGWLALVGTTNLAGNLGVPLAAGISVGVAVIVLVLAANVSLFGQIPSMVYGFACVAAYALLVGTDGDRLGTLYAANMADSALLNIIVSLVIGSLLGWVSEMLAVAMTARPRVAAA